jgi:hypothetical protein
MAFIGTPLDTRNTFQSLVGKRFNGDGSTTAFTLDVAPSSTLDIEVFVGNVRQDPNSAYTLSGTTLTFTGAPPSGTNNIYVVHQAKSVGTIDVPASGVQAGSLASSVLTGQTDIGGAIADADLFLVDDGAGGTLRKTAASRIKTYAGFSASDITGATALAEAPADTDEFIISDAGTLKRIDYSYIKGGTNTPYFSASITSNQTVTHDTMTLVNFDRADVDSASGYDTTNKRYAVPSGQGGYWMIGYNLYVSTSANKLKSIPVYLFKGGANLWSFNSRHQTVSYMRSDDNPLRALTLGNTVIGTLSAGDTVEVKATLGHSDGGSSTGTFNEYYSVFWGMKMAGA